MLEKLEKWLQKNESHAQVYQEQVEDMILRGADQKLTKEEVEEYHGPIHYVSNHTVLKPNLNRHLVGSYLIHLGHIPVTF